MVRLQPPFKLNNATVGGKFLSESRVNVHDPSNYEYFELFVNARWRDPWAGHRTSLVPIYTNGATAGLSGQAGVGGLPLDGHRKNLEPYSWYSDGSRRQEPPQIALSNA